MKDYDALKYFYNQIPQGLDILMVHNMPMVPPIKLKNKGSCLLYETILEKKPKYFFGGHWHRNLTDRHSFKIGNTQCFNAALLNDNYEHCWNATEVLL
jgi:hypothetical protein